MDNKNNYYSGNNGTANGYGSGMGQSGWGNSTGTTSYQQPGYQQTSYQQPNYQQSSYQQPGYQQSAVGGTKNGNMSSDGYSSSGYAQTADDEVVGVGAWFGYMTLLTLSSFIPFAGLLIAILMAFIPGKKSRMNYGKALLIFQIIAIIVGVVLAVLCVIFSASIMTMFAAILQEVMMTTYY